MPHFDGQIIIVYIFGSITNDNKGRILKKKTKVSCQVTSMPNTYRSQNEMWHLDLIVSIQKSVTNSKKRLFLRKKEIQNKNACQSQHLKPLKSTLDHKSHILNGCKFILANFELHSTLWTESILPNGKSLLCKERLPANYAID